MMDEGFKKYSEAIKKEQQSKIKRIFAWSKMLWKCFWRSLFLLSIANLPLTWVIGVMAHMDMMIPQMCVLTISKRQIMRLVELTFLCQTLKNTKKLIVF